MDFLFILHKKKDKKVDQLAKDDILGLIPPLSKFTLQDIFKKQTNLDLP